MRQGLFLIPDLLDKNDTKKIRLRVCASILEYFILLTRNFDKLLLCKNKDFVTKANRVNKIVYFNFQQIYIIYSQGKIRLEIPKFYMK